MGNPTVDWTAFVGGKGEMQYCSSDSVESAGRGAQRAEARDRVTSPHHRRFKRWAMLLGDPAVARLSYAAVDDKTRSV